MTIENSSEHAENKFVNKERKDLYDPVISRDVVLLIIIAYNHKIILSIEYRFTAKT
jgi:hypothetical protein